MRRRLKSVLLLAATSFLVMGHTACDAEARHQRAGLVEEVLVGNPGARFQAKLDTGADISSIDATDVEFEQHAATERIAFTVVRSDNTRVRLSAPLTRYIRVKRVGGRPTRRPVVRLEICLGSVSRRVEVTLADREGFDFPVLVGRNFLSGYFMVDPALHHLLAPVCVQRRSK